MKVSVVIPTYRRNESLKKLLSAFIAQRYGDFEVIIIDQNPSLSEDLKAVIDGGAGRVKYFVFCDKNAAAARNKGIEEARGEIIICCDDDILIGPGFLENHIKNYNDQTVGAVAGRVICANDLPLNKIKCVGKIRKWDGKVIANFNADFKTEVEHVYGCNASFRRDILVKVGGYDERLKGTGSFDDMDISFKVRGLGYKIIFDPAAEALHIQDSGGYRDIDFAEKMYWYYHNFMIFHLKHLPKLFLPFFLLRQLGGSLRRSIIARAPSMAMVCIKGMFNGLRDYKTKIIFTKENIKKILVTRTQGIGDAVCFIPSLKALREEFPKAEITILLGRSSTIEIFKTCPLTEKILFWDIEKNSYFFEKLRFILSLRKARYDLMVMSSQEVGFALKAFLSGAKIRIGFKEYVTNNIKSKDRFSFLNTVSLSLKEQEHEVNANFRLIETLGLKAKDKKLWLWLNKENLLFSEKIFQDYGLKDKAGIAVNVSSGRVVKNWPKENYAKLLKLIAQKYNSKIFLIGGQEMQPLNEEISKLSGVETVNLAGKTTFGQLCAFLSMCDLFIGNDSGPMHIAAAFDVAMVALFGPGDEARFGPYCQNSIVINKYVDCSPCNRQSCDTLKCMKAISVEEVMAAAEHFLKNISKIKKI